MWRWGPWHSDGAKSTAAAAAWRRGGGGAARGQRRRIETRAPHHDIGQAVAPERRRGLGETRLCWSLYPREAALEEPRTCWMSYVTAARLELEAGGA